MKITRTRLLAAVAGGLLVLPAGTAMAAGNENTSVTVGNCLSDGVYGNEPNIEDPYAPGGPAEQEPGTKGGRVVASQSPGPSVNNPADPDNPFPGRSVGQFKQDGIDVVELCKAYVDAAS